MPNMTWIRRVGLHCIIIRFCRFDGTILTWKSCMVGRKIVRRWIFDLHCIMFCRKFIFSMESHCTILSCEKFWRLLKCPWAAKSCFGETSVSDDLSSSVWVKTIITSLLNFSASVFFRSWSISSEWFCYRKWNSRVLLIESESVWSRSWGEKSLRR